MNITAECWGEQKVRNALFLILQPQSNTNLPTAKLTKPNLITAS
jgi:hypothetical protein